MVGPKPKSLNERYLCGWFAIDCMRKNGTVDGQMVRKMVEEYLSKHNEEKYNDDKSV